MHEPEELIPRYNKCAVVKYLDGVFVRQQIGNGIQIGKGRGNWDQSSEVWAVFCRRLHVLTVNLGTWDCASASSDGHAARTAG